MKISKSPTKWREKLFGVILIIAALNLFFLRVSSLSAGESFVRVTYDTGETVVPREGLPRIVSLYAGHTENLIAIGARGAIVAIGHEGEDLGMSVPVLGIKPGIEQMIALSPDVVLTRPMMANSRVSFYNTLKSMGIRVLSIDPPTWDEFPEYIDTLSRIVGVGDGPKKEMIETMRESGAVNESRIAVFLVTNGRTMATCTPDSWAAHIIELAGFSNAASNAVPISKGSVVAGFGAERLMALGDEIDVVLLQQGAMNTTLAEDFMRDPRFATMRAVRNGMVFDVPEADISRPSLLRLANGAVHALRDLVYSREAVK